MTRLITKQMRDSFNLHCFDEFCKKPSEHPNEILMMYWLFRQQAKKQRILILKGTIK